MLVEPGYLQAKEKSLQSPVRQVLVYGGFQLQFACESRAVHKVAATGGIANRICVTNDSAIQLIQSKITKGTRHPRETVVAVA